MITSANTALANDPAVRVHMDKAVAAVREAEEVRGRAKTESREVKADERETIEKALAVYKSEKAAADQELSLLEAKRDISEGRPTFPLADGEKQSKKDSGLNLKSVLKWARYGDNAPEAKSLSSLRDHEGALLLTPDTTQPIMRQIRDDIFILRRARVFTTNAQQVPIRTFNKRNTPAPVPAEGGTPSVASYTGAFGKTMLTPHPYQIEIQIPRDLIEDDTMDDVEAMVREEISFDFAEQTETDYLNGNGIQRPLGVLPSGIPFQPLGAATPDAEEVRAAPTYIRKGYRKNADACYTMNRDIVRSVMLLRDESGGAGTGSFMWQPSLVAGQPEMLNGYPVEETEFWPTISGAGDPVFLFGNYRMGYDVALKSGLRVQRLVEDKARERMIVLLAEISVDAAPVRREAFVRFNRP
ncbi:MAG: hypothetical protein A3E78_14245 [Alphaproteobacteria bacterium RIFCSPHIGHO2_12_FULL_63_12]|nr:MAG: hypothetical protein A3E78_14245 [Alphaproteobacteria bacterium RIFCSPHIGHO2_12_FULL_63_12]